MNDRDPYFFVVAALIATVLAAWLIYVPIFMRLLRRFSDAEFRRARGRYFFSGKVLDSCFTISCLVAIDRCPTSRFAFMGV